MHLIKSIVSGLLLLTSICWIGIQHVFLTPESFSRIIVNSLKPFYNNRNFHHNSHRHQHTHGAHDFLLQLKRDWCRVKSKRIAWREILGSCRNNGDLFTGDKRYDTNPQLSQVSRIDIKGAGEHTILRIDTFTNYGAPKTFGGDSIRVVFRGPNVIRATVFDLRNGSYDAIAFLKAPGFYEVKVVLEYTQCKGIKDPATEWYVKAHCASSQNNNTLIGADISSQMSDYIDEAISPGIIIKIPPPKYNLRLLPKILGNIDCGFKCRNVWDGHGVWQAKQGEDGGDSGSSGSNSAGGGSVRYWRWEETIPNDNHQQTDKRPNKNGTRRNTFWVYGDSISYYFFQRVSTSEICTRWFQSCNNTYNWIYPKTLYEMRHFCEDIDVNENRIIRYFNDVLSNPKMDNNSVIIFNLGAHFVKNTSFRKYRSIISRLMEELNKFGGQVIWKSTTAIHKQDIQIMGAFRRYLTNQRVELFNAYVNSMVCTYNHHLLDVYPLTASYPDGTKDGVHYHRKASKPMEEMLVNYFSQD